MTDAANTAPVAPATEQSGGNAFARLLAGGGDKPVDPLVSQAKENIQKRKRGRPSNAERAARGDSPASGSSVTKPAAAHQAALAAEVAEMFTPEAWESVVTMPADTMLAATGHKHWNLSEKDVKKLSVTTSKAAAYFMRVDPKWLILALFLFNTSAVYGPRVVEEMKIRRTEREEKAKAKTDLKP